MAERLRDRRQVRENVRVVELQGIDERVLRQVMDELATLVGVRRVVFAAREDEPLLAVGRASGPGVFGWRLPTPPPKERRDGFSSVPDFLNRATDAVEASFPARYLVRSSHRGDGSDSSHAGGYEVGGMSGLLDQPPPIARMRATLVARRSARSSTTVRSWSRAAL